MATFHPTPSSVDQKLASLPDSLGHSNDTMMYLNQHSMMFDPPPSATTSYRHMNSPIGDLVGSSVNGDLQNFQTQGLSLSLGTEMPFHYQCMSSGDGSYKSKEELMGTVKAESGNPLMHMGMYLYDSADLADTISNSKYLKETQQMLDEVVNVQEALKVFDSRKRRKVLASGLDASEEAGERSGNQSTEILPAELKDLQIKKTKLVSMMDEVDKRYRQYHHQMQVLESSFDSIAGYGAAKPYTTLAQQAISRHFRSLHDAINGQIRVIKKSLGEQETGIPRLRSVDRQIRQQRSLQHLGVMRHAWRPQRGLPESSVSILRSWLFEHFLHPYPNDSEKITLARQTGLSRNQVANWFINARVRLWKPMVEEMYKEEFGDSELDSKSLENPSKDPRESFSAHEDGEEELQDITKSTARMASQSGFHEDNVTHSGSIRPMMDHSLLGATETDDMAELNGFGFGDLVSLATARPGTLDYHYVDTGKQQHRFGSAHQLHDFVV